MRPSRALKFEEVLSDELAEIQKSRTRRLPEVGSPKASSGADVYTAAHDAQLVGLAFSGGGIRSATFNLGVMQALAEMDILRWVDYLSTVSGGGYIGSWLTAWITGHSARNSPPTPVKDVQDRIAPGKSTQFSKERLNPIHFLREYSNYLTPRLGFFGADTWTLISIYLRNVILNQAILVSFIAAVLMLPRFARWPFDAASEPGWAVGLSLLALLVAMVFIGWNLWRLEPNGAGGHLPFYARQGWVQCLIAFPVLAAAYSSTVAAWEFVGGRDTFPKLSESWTTWLLVGMVFASLLLITGVCGAFRRGRKVGKVAGTIGLVLLSSVLPGAAGGLMLFGVARLLFGWKHTDSGIWHAVAWGPPLLIAVFSLTAVLHLGLMGLRFPDSGREWWSRLGAWLSIYLLGWTALTAVTIYGPLVLALGVKAVTGVSLAWVATTVGGLIKGRSTATGKAQPGGWEELLAKGAPYVFVAGLLVAIATGLQLALPCLDAPSNACAVQGNLFTLWSGMSFSQVAALHFLIMNGIGWPTLGMTLLVLAVIALILGWRVDINEFSMHRFYRNRLIRCYLGASHPREPQAFTGFDPRDDMPLAHLAGENFTGPYPIINATLNLVRGEDLAWQQRKGTSFVLTPLYSGYQIADRPAARGDARPSLNGDGTWPAYRRTRDCGYPRLGGITLGTAVAISGAAASPNEGYHSSPATTFLMTVFDVRLGWWLGNPARAKYGHAAPRFALLYLLRELFGLTDHHSNFVYLSDGGHFENLGIYELVRRRCRYVIACDADQDGDLHFEDLGSAIRKCRTDMGVDIDIDVGSLRRQPDNPFSRWHCAVGTIHYENLGEGATPGTLVYIKSSLTGDEAEDVLSYHNQQPDFPHQSTADQWFDESQFESYRKLGYHAGSITFAAVDQQQPMKDGVESFFVALRQAWYPASSAVAASFSKHANALDQLFERLRKDRNLQFLDAQIYPEWRNLMADTAQPPAVDLWLPADPEQLRGGFYFCNSLIQLMENVYLDLHLDQERDHPDNRGWMNLFKHWSWSGMFRVTWALSASTYGARFQTFCRRALSLEPGEVRTERKPFDAAELNFHERALVTEFRRLHQDVDTHGALHLLQLVVSDVTAPEPSRAATIRFTFGFALLDRHKLVLFRTQDHLRKMGLARRALGEMIRKGDLQEFDPSPLEMLNTAPRAQSEAETTEEIRNMGSPGNLRRFDQLFRSVAREPGKPARAAGA